MVGVFEEIVDSNMMYDNIQIKMHHRCCDLKKGYGDVAIQIIPLCNDLY